MFRLFSSRVNMLEGSIRSSLLRFALPIVFGSLLQTSFNSADKIVLGQMAGSAAVAAIGVCTCPVTLIVNFFIGLSNGVAVVFARFLGARQHDRVRSTMRWGFIYNLAVTATIAAVIFALRRPLLTVFLPKDPTAVEYGSIRMEYVCMIYFINCLNSTLSHILIGFGHAALTSADQIVSTVVFRTFWMQIIYPMAPSFRRVSLCFSVSWTISLIGYLAIFFVVYLRFRKGKVRQI